MKQNPYNECTIENKHPHNLFTAICNDEKIYENWLFAGKWIMFGPPANKNTEKYAVISNGKGETVKKIISVSIFDSFEHCLSNRWMDSTPGSRGLPNAITIYNSIHTEEQRRNNWVISLELSD